MSACRRCPWNEPGVPAACSRPDCGLRSEIAEQRRMLRKSVGGDNTQPRIETATRQSAAAWDDTSDERRSRRREWA